MLETRDRQQLGFRQPDHPETRENMAGGTRKTLSRIAIFSNSYIPLNKKVKGGKAIIEK